MKVTLDKKVVIQILVQVLCPPTADLTTMKSNCITYIMINGQKVIGNTLFKYICQIVCLFQLTASGPQIMSGHHAPQHVDGESNH